MIHILNYFIMIEQPAYHFNYLFFRVVDFSRDSSASGCFLMQGYFYIFHNKIKLIFAQIKFISLAADITNTAPVRFFSKIFE